MHCHLDAHQSWGLGTAIIVKNGKGEFEKLPPPPVGLPLC